MKTSIVTIMCSIALAVAAFGTGHAYAKGTIVVGGKNFTEQLLMAAITSELLRANGYDVATKDGIGSSMLRKAQINGEIDIYWGYTGVALVIFNKVNAKGLSEKESIRKVRKLDSKKGLTWLQCSNVNDTWAVAVRDNGEKTTGMKNISDFAKAYRNGKKIRFGATTESANRKDALLGLEAAYNFNIPRSQLHMMTVGLYMRALKSKQLDASMITSTDGRLSAFHLRTLKDNKHFFPNYTMCPVIRTATLKKYPGLKGILGKLASKIDTTTMRQLNAEVSVKHRAVKAVAKEFLKDNGLI